MKVEIYNDQYLIECCIYLRLQEGVPETIEAMREAGIKVSITWGVWEQGGEH